jgi:hypothetical protein
LTVVCISREKEDFIEGINFYCQTEGYRPILHHDNKSPERIEYITSRYNNAINEALRRFPDTERIMICDSYYLHQADVPPFINRHLFDHDEIVGCSIWYNYVHNVWNNLKYYDVLSVKEFRGKAWHSPKQLPRGVIPVSGVGACWIFPRRLWNGGFRYDWTGESLVNSWTLDTDGVKILLDCDTRLWRTSENNPDIYQYSWPKRIRVSAGAIRRRIF